MTGAKSRSSCHWKGISAILWLFCSPIVVAPITTTVIIVIVIITIVIVVVVVVLVVVPVGLVLLLILASSSPLSPSSGVDLELCV